MSNPSPALELLLSKFPKRYGIKNTQYLLGLVQAFAAGDDYIESTVEAVRDNLIAVTATGRFLDRAAGRYGIVRGQGSGLLDPDFQKLIPLMGMSPKQISDTLLRMIDIFYGPYASHANTSCSASEPYNLQNGSDLRIRMDDSDIGVTFSSSDFININAATAMEVATAISNKTEGNIIGSVVSDIRTGENFVNIRTKTIGSQGFIQVLGGSAQSVLQFPEIRPVTGSLSTWSVAAFQGTDEMMYTVTSGPIPNFGTAGVLRGDYVTIRPDSGFNTKNTGTFRITFVGSGFFRCINPIGVQQSGITNLQTDDFTFFRPDLGNVLLSSRPAALVETSPRQLTIIIPVTAPVVKRTLKGGHHFHNAVSTVLSATSNSVQLTNSASFDGIGAIRPLTSRLFSKGIVSTTGVNTVTLINAQNWPTQGSFWAPNERQFYYYQGISGNTLQNVTPTPPSSLAGIPVVYTERYSYTSISGNTLNGVFPDPSGLIALEVASAGAQSIADYPGSFLYDPKAPFIASENLTTLQQSIEQGQVTTLVRMADVSSFNESGHFILEFGTDRQEGPIRYLSKVGSSTLIVDPGHIYQFDHPVGVGVRMIRQIGAYVPRADGTDLAVYTTSTSPARDLLATYLRTIAASGVQLRFEIIVPSQKWAILPNLYTTNPLDTSLIPPV
jgi:hypothetical protein